MEAGKHLPIRPGHRLGAEQRRDRAAIGNLVDRRLLGQRHHEVGLGQSEDVERLGVGQLGEPVDRAAFSAASGVNET